MQIPLEGITRIRCTRDAPETIDALIKLAGQHGLKMFARIDFAADAAASGLSLRPEQMLIFGNPRAGTPLLEAAPTAGLDLPIKALVWEDESGETWLAYNDAAYIVARHRVPTELAKNIDAASALMAAAANPSTAGEPR